MREVPARHAVARAVDEVTPERLGEPKQAAAGDKVCSPCVGRDYPDRVLFGDTHVHTDTTGTRIRVVGESPSPQPSATKTRNQAPPDREFLIESGYLWRGGRDSNPQLLA